MFQDLIMALFTEAKQKIGNLIVGWNEEKQEIVVVPTVPDLSGCGDPAYYRRLEIFKGISQ